MTLKKSKKGIFYWGHSNLLSKDTFFRRLPQNFILLIFFLRLFGFAATAGSHQICGEGIFFGRSVWKNVGNWELTGVNNPLALKKALRSLERHLQKNVMIGVKRVNKTVWEIYNKKSQPFISYFLGQKCCKLKRDSFSSSVAIKIHLSQRKFERR